MLDRLLSFLKGGDAPEKAGSDLALAAAVLLLEAAAMDDSIDPAETDKVEGLLIRHFDLDPAGARAVMETAAKRRAESTQLLRFTRRIKDGMDAAERERLIEWLWDVIYADGKEHDMEANLMRRIAGLIYVDDAISGQARKRVRRRLGLEA
ncbi:putative tellurite resistance protein B-like protein [Zavarzinia compransoris]|nr:putative tellurite resistance protein B-like protein [Zavarzinia compransoris]